MNASTPNPAIRPGNARRFLAIGALLAGLGAAWWTSEGGNATIQASFLLSRVSPVAGVDGGRERLTALKIGIPSRAHDVIGWTHTLTFGRGSAPMATAAMALELPRDVTNINLSCRFQIGAEAQTWTHTRAAVDRDKDDVQVIDVGTCR